MTGPAALPEPAARLAGRVIRAACWALPHAERAERELEWTAEDTDVHLPGLRAVWFALSLLLHAPATRGTHAAPAQPTHHRTIRDIIPSHVDSVQIIAFVVATFAEVVLGAAPSSASPPSPPGIGGGEGVTGAVGGSCWAGHGGLRCQSRSHGHWPTYVGSRAGTGCCPRRWTRSLRTRCRRSRRSSTATRPRPHRHPNTRGTPPPDAGDLMDRGP